MARPKRLQSTAGGQWSTGDFSKARLNVTADRPHSDKQNVHV